MDNYICVDPLSSRPIECWKKYKRLGRVSGPAKTLRLDTPVFDNKVRFVCISDTHERLDEFLPIIPDGDVLIHAGDFTNYGDLGEVIKFNSEIGQLPHKYKLVIPGNHELGFEDGEVMNDKQMAGLNMLGIKKAYELLSNCPHYLSTRSIDGYAGRIKRIRLRVDHTHPYAESGPHYTFPLCVPPHLRSLKGRVAEAYIICVYGIKVYGTPWHSMPGYSFYRPRGQKILHKWNMIPPKTDVLITHTPPLGHGDFNSWDKMDGILAGDVELLNTVEQRVVPKYHVFGHVHQMHGATTNGTTTFINASLCDHKLRSAYDPIIFDLPLPRGVSK
ncbi:Ser/Thr phosphatase family protein [Cooperia oncophora]